MRVDTSATPSAVTGACDSHARQHGDKIERIAQLYCGHPANVVHIVLRQQLRSTYIPEKYLWNLAQRISRGITRL